MEDKRFFDFKRLVLRDQEPPDDLYKLWLMQLSRSPDSAPSDPLTALGAKLIDPGALPVLISHAYLTVEDRANVDIMCNIAAFDVVFDMSTFVAELDDDSVLGYWHGPERISIHSAPILQLDTEGQFSLLPGRTLTEAIMSRALEYRSETDFRQAAKRFTDHGIGISAGALDDLEYPDAETQPNSIHRQAYNQNRIAAGLEPV